LSHSASSEKQHDPAPSPKGRAPRAQPPERVWRGPSSGSGGGGAARRSPPPEHLDHGEDTPRWREEEASALPSSWRLASEVSGGTPRGATPRSGTGGSGGPAPAPGTRSRGGATARPGRRRRGRGGGEGGRAASGVKRGAVGRRQAWS
jgi:hypothetical protein